MLSFYVAKIRDDKDPYRVFYDNSLEGARSQADRIHLIVESMEARESPLWHIVEPIMCKPIIYRRQKGYIAKNQLLANGPVGTFYRGDEYIVQADIFPKDRKVKNQDGKTITAIGQATITCEAYPDATKTIYLEPIDEQHALDLLDGVLIAWDAELKSEQENNINLKM
jgi:hypothetical protein